MIIICQPLSKRPLFIIFYLFLQTLYEKKYYSDFIFYFILFLLEPVTVLEAPPYREKSYGDHSCNGVCGRSILAGHIATPNKIVFLLMKKKERMDLG